MSDPLEPRSMTVQLERLVGVTYEEADAYLRERGYVRTGTTFDRGLATYGDGYYFATGEDKRSATYRNKEEKLVVRVCYVSVLVKAPDRSVITEYTLTNTASILPDDDALTEQAACIVSENGQRDDGSAGGDGTGR